MKHQNLRPKLKLLPRSPGVYIMKNINGDIIYIGKSNNLRQRVSSYFQPSSQAFSKVRKIVENIYDFDYIITSSEMEALILECNLIEEYLPKYNVRFKDGKGYPYIKINLKDPFPFIEVTRKVRRDGAKYYGPYTKGLRNYLKLFQSLFPLRACKGKIRPNPKNRPCMNYHIKKCAGPCLGEISQEEYKKILEDGCRFLEGKHQGLIENLKLRIKESIKELNFERAALLRDQILALEKYSEKHRIVFSSTKEEGDFIGSAMEGNLSSVEIYLLREGRLTGHERFILDIMEETARKELLSYFIKQFYRHSTNIPSLIYLEEEPDDILISEWLSAQKGSKVKIIVPKKGKKKELVTMALNNGKEYLKNYIAESSGGKEKARNSLLELKTSLNLPILPVRIEAFDISNISGKYAVGSMVVFEGGFPRKSSYRRYKIRTKETPDDFTMMKEIIKRRYKKLQEEKGNDIPDLIMVDGGKGQLNIALKVLKELNINIPLISIAKEEEMIFKPDNKNPIIMKKNSESFYLLQRIRDEAHRFAVSYHRKLRTGRIKTSFLNTIPGIGEKRKNSLLKYFGSLQNIKKASQKEIAQVEGMNRKIAEILYRKLRET